MVELDRLPLLPGFEVPVVEPRPRRHAEMLRLYGGRSGEHCRHCIHLVRKTGDFMGHYLKCELAGISHGAATDWRAKWLACGKYEERRP